MSAVAETTSPASTAETAPEVIDVEALLAPIPGDNPSGEDLKYSGVYDEIRAARTSDDNLAQGDWKRETKSADWDRVETLAVEALTTRTKDLQICAWMSEAITRNYGFAGLRDGLKVMRGLHERFWETVYPQIDRDEDDPEAPADLTGRANALSILDRQATAAAKDVPITGSRLGTDYSYLQFDDSKPFQIPEKLEDIDSDEVSRITAMRERAAEEGKITSEEWNKAKAATPRSFYEKLAPLLEECWTEFQALDAVMDETFKRDTPGLGMLKKALEEIREQVGRLLKEKRLLEPDPVSADGAGDGAGADGNGSAVDGGGGGLAFAGAGGATRSRQEALKKLSEVADYFRRTEPHSPVSYLVQRAIKWGQMPLEAWLEDVVKDAGVLDAMRETLGLKTSPDATNGGGAPEGES
ncbi:MAG TPA: type VI secretion system protein TssA [Pyrinomonadaceae bacterium]|jgi:type VI secretion system protein ImpA